MNWIDGSIPDDTVSTEKRAYRQRVRAERQAQTRRRIAAAAAALHEEVGPARTTMTEVARRAGVQRATVYANFPEEADLLAASQRHFLRANPPPDLAPALGLPEASERVAAALAALYGWYRRTRRTSANVRRDRAGMPALDALLRESVDEGMVELGAALATGGGPAHALVMVALDFWTWERLDAQGLDDGEAAALMARAVAAAMPRVGQPGGVAIAPPTTSPPGAV